MIAASYQRISTSLLFSFFGVYFVKSIFKILFFMLRKRSLITVLGNSESYFDTLLCNCFWSEKIEVQSWSAWRAAVVAVACSWPCQ